MNSLMKIVLEFNPWLECFLGQTAEQRKEVTTSLGTMFVWPEHILDAGRQLALDGHQASFIGYQGGGELQLETEPTD